MEQLQTLIKIRNCQKGQMLVEILLVIALTAIMLPALLTGLFSSKQGKAQQAQRVRAVALMKEAEEVVRNVRNQGWGGFSVNGMFHPLISGTTWSLVSGNETLNGLTRAITVSDVYRDSNGVIVTSGGTLDPSTKGVYIQVTWGQPYISSVDSTLYLTRFLQNASSTQTNVDDFNAGSNSGTTVTNSSGGEVVLSAGGGGGDWCDPSLSVTTVDLSRQGIPTAISATSSATQNIIATGTGGNASGPTFVSTLTSGNSPVNATFSGEFDNSKANGVFTLNNYGYIATDSNSEEIKVVSLTQYSNPPTNTKFLKVGAFNAPGNTQGNSIFVSGNYGYMTAADKFYIFNTSTYVQQNATAVTLSGTGKKVVVVGNYAYIMTDATSNQFQVINVANPASPSNPTSLTLGSLAGVDLTINQTGTRAYAVTTHSSTEQELYIINITDPSSPQKIGGTGYNTSSMSPKGVSLVTGNKAIIVGTGGTYQYQVVNISTETAPVECGHLAIINGAYAVSSILQSDGYAYSYVATGDSTAELKIILGGSGGQFSTLGEFTSNAIDASVSASFNYFNPIFTLPPGTQLQFKVAVANTPTDSCDDATYTFVGPDGQTNSFYSNAGQIPLTTISTYSNPGRCMKYRAYLSTSDINSSPILENVWVNYSP